MARASGSEDLRTQRPYGAYGLVAVPAHRSGTAAAPSLANWYGWKRYGVRSSCAAWLSRASPSVPLAGPGRWRSLPSRHGWGWAEAPQGELLYMVEVEGNRLRRVKPRSASFHNLSLFSEAFGGDIFTDFAFIEASFGLSIAGVAG